MYFDAPGLSQPNTIQYILVQNTLDDLESPNSTSSQTFKHKHSWCSRVSWPNIKLKHLSINTLNAQESPNSTSSQNL